MNSNPCTQLPTSRRRFVIRGQAFTLIEVLLSMVILAGIMLIVTQVIGQAQRSWKSASSRVTQFREARTAFDTLIRGLRQATLPTYRDWEYNGKPYPEKWDSVPTNIRQYADLGFVAGRAADIVPDGGGASYLPGHAVIFQAPMGKTAKAPYQKLTSLLNVRGYFVHFGSDKEYLPAALSNRLQPKNRYRLFEYRPTTEDPADGRTMTDDQFRAGAWASISSHSEHLMPVAENIVALAMGFSFAATETTTVQDLASPATAKDSTASYFAGYDSFSGKTVGGTGGAIEKGKLPRTVQVIMVALDEESAGRIAEKNTSGPPGVLARAGSAFTDPATYERDIEALAKSMLELHINYRVFSSIILIPGSNT